MTTLEHIAAWEKVQNAKAERAGAAYRKEQTAILDRARATTATCTTCGRTFPATSTPHSQCVACWLIPRLPAPPPAWSLRARADDPETGADDDGPDRWEREDAMARQHQDEDSRREESRIAHE
jgi:hypothetical protein